MTSGRSALQQKDGVSDTHVVRSPVTGEAIDEVSLASKREIAQAIARVSAPDEPMSAQRVFAFLDRLREQLAAHRDILVERTVLETGFITTDSLDIVNATVEFVADFETFVRERPRREPLIRHSYSQASTREMRIIDRPVRCVAAVVPQNASLSLAITIIASALYAGSRVILRPSLQCASTGVLLRDILERSGVPPGRVEIVNCLASDFINASCESEEIDLIHYIGSNQYALSVFQQAFASGKVCLLDGQGNGLLYVDESFSVDEAVRIITSGATRFNGETCTSVNGVLAHPSVYSALRSRLTESMSSLVVGDPREPRTQVGPLFSAEQASSLRSQMRKSQGRLLCGGESRGAYLSPAFLDGVHPDEDVVRRGFFGPVLWLRSVESSEVCAWLRRNMFPLSDTVLSHQRAVVQRFAADARAARICVNEDPSVESMFEPWGGYPPSGLNPVSIWTEKYRQAFQVDGKLKDILAADSDSPQSV